MRKWYPRVLVMLSAVASIVAYPQLPDRVPTHWGLHGQVDRYGPKWLAVGLFPVFMLVLWGIMRGLPKIDPRRENYVKFQSTYDLLVNAALTMALALQGITIAAAFGVEMPMARVFPLMLGVFFVVLGNALPRARPNWWFGIRTPWTLSNDRVWERTHRVGGYLFVALGIAMVVMIVLPETVALVAMGVLGAATVVSTLVYSYVAWRQEMSR